ncbi:skin secretory protein xP2-like [Iris pallida]|uniref:Skin secretory protein xP2-like n=1 Tax=Iris pallida TaxID=29817 RepID=A0AAX6GHW1_IRIPA|nr:skin secretory protein xP2-like [Iris pallida]
MKGEAAALLLMPTSLQRNREEERKGRDTHHRKGAAGRRWPDSRTVGADASERSSSAAGEVVLRTAERYSPARARGVLNQCSAEIQRGRHPTADGRIVAISEVALLEIASCSDSSIAGVDRTDNHAAEASGGWVG